MQLDMNGGLLGLHTFTDYLPRCLQDQKLLDELEKWMSIGKGHIWKPKVEHLITDQVTYKNLTTTLGRGFLMQILCNTATGTNKYVTHFGIGTSNTAANVADTQLGAETFRKSISSALDSTNTANISVFVGASEANFTWQEYGYFIDGTATANSGTILSHFIQSVAKSAPATKTVDSVFTLADV